MSDEHAPITAAHRLIAYQCARGVDAPAEGTPAHRWVVEGLGDYRDWQRVAQAIADAEVRGRSIIVP